MQKFLFAIAVMFSIFCSTICADNTFMARQNIGGNTLYGLFHNEQFVGTELIYNNKPWLLFGVGPHYSITKGTNGLKIFGYIALTSNVAKKQWPIEKAEVDTFIMPKLGTWNLCFRTRAGLELANNNACVYWGEDYVGYQATKALQIQLRTEWRNSPKWTQSIGPALSSQIADIRFNGYIGMETKYPYAKTGWLEVRMAK